MRPTKPIANPRNRFVWLTIAASLAIVRGGGAAYATAPQGGAPLDLERWIDAYVDGSRALEAGDLALAQERLLAALELAPQNPQTLHQLAALAAGRGQSDAALELLRRAMVAGFDDAALLEWDPDLASLRSDPTFRRLVTALRSLGSEPSRVAEAPIARPLTGVRVAITSDARLVAIQGKDLCVVDVTAVPSGRIVAEIPLAERRVERLAFSRSGAHIGVEYTSPAADLPRRVLVYDLVHRRIASDDEGTLDARSEFVPAADPRETTIDDPIFARLELDDPSRTILVEREGAFVVVDPRSGGELERFYLGRPPASWSAAIGEIVAVGGPHFLVRAKYSAAADSEALIVDVDTRSAIPLAWTASVDSIADIAVAPDARAIALLHWTGEVRVYQPKGGWVIAHFQPPLVEPGVAVTRSSSHAVIGGRAGGLDVVDLATGRVVARHQSPRKRDLKEFALVESDAAVFARDDIGTIRFDLATGAAVFEQPAPFVPAPHLGPAAVVQIDLDPSPGFEVTRVVADPVTRCALHQKSLWVGTSKSCVFVFDLTTESEPVALDLADLDPFDTVEVGNIEFSPDGQTVVITSSGAAVVAAYDIPTLRRKWSIEYDEGNPFAVRARFSANSKTVALFGQGDWIPRLVDAVTGETRLDLAFRGVRELYPTDDPGLVLAYSERGIEAIEVPSGRVRWSRLDLRDGAVIERSNCGFVFGSSNALSQIHTPRADGSEDLATLAPYLLDRKKIRAAVAGVIVTPPRLPPP